MKGVKTLEPSIQKSADYLTWFAIAGIFLSTALLFARVISNLAFEEPLLIETSGFEVSSLYAMWKWVKGLPIYADTFAIPYAASYFNFMFYLFYGSCINTVLFLMDLGPEWIPTLGRWVTLSFCVAGCWLSWIIFSNLLKKTSGFPKILILGLSVYAFTSPFIGFWAITVRPDVAAYFFEVLGFYVFARFYKTDFAKTCIATVALSYVAWSFKQSSVSCLAGILIFLVLERKLILALCIFSGITVLWALTYWIAGPDYTFNTFYSLYQNPFVLEAGIRNITLFAVKYALVLPAFFLLVFICIAGCFKSMIRSSDDFRLIVTILGFSLLFSFLTSNKLGASDNYYFIPSFFLMASTVFILNYLFNQNALKQVVIFVWSAAWVLHIVAICLVMLGIRGEVSHLSLHVMHKELKTCMDLLPKPVFVEDRFLNLPWFKTEDYFIRSMNYDLDRLAGRAVEKGGVGGLIRDQYFASLMIDTAFRHSFDGATYDGYKIAELPDCPSTINIFIREQDVVAGQILPVQ
ncbi:hypothetical protein ACFL1S_07420 [Pseudomonadota bacterium]